MKDYSRTKKFICIAFGFNENVSISSKEGYFLVTNADGEEPLSFVNGDMSKKTCQGHKYLIQNGILAVKHANKTTFYARNLAAQSKEYVDVDAWRVMSKFIVIFCGTSFTVLNKSNLEDITSKTLECLKKLENVPVK